MTEEVVFSAYGFEVSELVIEKRTGRCARIERFSQEYGWRWIDNQRRRVPLQGEYSISYRWMEPAKGRTRTTNETFMTDRETFLRRFRKQENARG
jgi:hypothetical protein